MNCNTSQYKETDNQILYSIHQTTQHLLDATSAERDAISSHSPALSQPFAEVLLRAIMRLEHLLFLGMDNTEFPCVDLWTKAAKRSDQVEDIDLWVEPAKITVRLPYLPHRYKGNQDALAKLLAAKINESIDFPHWETWHADFIHLYPTQFKGVPKDVDNYSYKRVIDVLAFGLHTDDSAQHFDMAVTTVFSDEYLPGVYIEITPKHPATRKLPSAIAILEA